jgi:hypothetical protein
MNVKVTGRSIAGERSGESMRPIGAQRVETSLMRVAVGAIDVASASAPVDGIPP